MGSKWLLALLTVMSSFGANALEPLSDALNDCYHSQNEKFRAQKESEIDEQKIVPMIDEIARRAKTSVTRIQRAMPDRSAIVFQSHFPQQINQNSKLLQVDRSGLADELRKTLIGRGSQDSDWKLAGESKFDVDAHDHFFSAAGTLEYKDKTLYSVACINIGRVQSDNFLADLRCQELTSQSNDKVHLRRFFNPQKEFLKEEQMYRMLRAPMREMYACFLSQSQS